MEKKYYTYTEKETSVKDRENQRKTKVQRLIHALCFFVPFLLFFMKNHLNEGTPEFPDTLDQNLSTPTLGEKTNSTENTLLQSLSEAVEKGVEGVKELLGSTKGKVLALSTLFVLAGCPAPTSNIPNVAPSAKPSIGLDPVKKSPDKYANLSKDKLLQIIMSLKDNLSIEGDVTFTENPNKDEGHAGTLTLKNGEKGNFTVVTKGADLKKLLEQYKDGTVKIVQISEPKGKGIYIGNNDIDTLAQIKEGISIEQILKDGKFSGTLSLEGTGDKDTILAVVIQEKGNLVSKVTIFFETARGQAGGGTPTPTSTPGTATTPTPTPTPTSYSGGSSSNGNNNGGGNPSPTPTPTSTPTPSPTATPNPNNTPEVNNAVRSGTTLTLTGKFENPTITTVCNGSTLTLPKISSTSTQLVLNLESVITSCIPEGETQKTITLTITNSNGKTTTVSVNLEKPASAKVQINAPTQTLFKQGDTFTLTGQNLDQVKTVKIGTTTVPYTVINSTTIQITVPTTLTPGTNLPLTVSDTTTNYAAGTITVEAKEVAPLPQVDIDIKDSNGNAQDFLSETLILSPDGSDTVRKEVTITGIQEGALEFSFRATLPTGAVARFILPNGSTLMAGDFYQINLTAGETLTGTLEIQVKEGNHTVNFKANIPDTSTSRELDGASYTVRGRVMNP